MVRKLGLRFDNSHLLQRFAERCTYTVSSKGTMSSTHALRPVTAQAGHGIIPVHATGTNTGEDNISMFVQDSEGCFCPMAVTHLGLCYSPLPSWGLR